MIGILAREQWRFQRLYIVWAAAIVAAAVGFATFATLSAATQGALDDFSQLTALQGAPLMGTAVITDSGISVPEPAEDWGTPITTAELNRTIDQANASGAGAFASAQGYVAMASGHSPEDAGQPTIVTGGEVSAVWGTPDWPTILAEGSAPGSGDIVLPGSTARYLGVHVGDTIQIGATVDNGGVTERFVSEVAARVSGITYDSSLYSMSPAFISSGDLPLLVTATLANNRGDDWPLQATVGAQHSVPALDTLTMYSSSTSSRPTLTQWELPWALAALFGVGALVTAFTLGRTQARSRVQWVATARALGARRAHLVGVAVWEWALIGVVGAAAGIGSGWAAAAWAHTQRMAELAEPAPVGLTVPTKAIVLLAALALGLAAAIVAVPSFLAVRVPPTAALKETAAVDAAPLTRRLPLWPVAALFLVTWSGTMLLTRFYSPRTENLYIACLFAAAASCIALVVQWCRRMVRFTAARLGRSNKPWAVHASMTMTGHPQQTAALAIIQALLMTGIAGVTITRDTSSASFGWVAYAPVSQVFTLRGVDAFLSETIPAPLSATTVMALLAAVQVFVLAIAASARAVAWRETSTAGALGLTRWQAAKGDAFSWWIAQAQGAWIGACAGAVGMGAVWLVSWNSVNSAVGSQYGGLPRQLLAIAVIVALSLAIAAIVSAAASLVLRPRHDTRSAPKPA